jgi:hypothetical protein
LRRLHPVRLPRTQLGADYILIMPIKTGKICRQPVERTLDLNIDFIVWLFPILVHRLI